MPHPPVGKPKPEVSHSGHAELGPSAAKRWMTCTGSPGAIAAAVAHYGEEPPSEYAEVGTAIHEAGDASISDPSISPEDLVGQVFHGHEISRDDLDAFQDYVKYCRSLAEDADWWACEQLVVVIPGKVWGTADFMAVIDNTLYVIDLKTGYNRVEAAENPQLKLYALGALLEIGMVFDIEQVITGIAQERIGHFDLHEYSAEELLEWKAEVERVLDEIENSPQLVPSDEACQYCRARSTCPALREQVVAEAEQDFRDMTSDQLCEAWEALPMLRHYISGVEARIKETLEGGGEVPGLKLVQGRRTRKWKDEDDAQRYLSRRMRKFKQTCFTHKFMSPAQVEKQIASQKAECILVREVPDETFKGLIEVLPGKPTIAKEDDSREEIVYGDRAAADFASVNR
jgi:hypothetical protein